MFLYLTFFIMSYNKTVYNIVFEGAFYIMMQVKSISSCYNKEKGPRKTKLE